MTSDTTKADQKAELDRQQHVIDEVSRAHVEELPLLGGANGVPVEPAEEASAGVLTTEALPGVVTEKASGKGKG